MSEQPKNIEPDINEPSMEEKVTFAPHEREDEIRDELKTEIAEGPVGEVFQRIDEAYEILNYLSAGKITNMQEGLDKARVLLDQATKALGRVSKKEDE